MIRRLLASVRKQRVIPKIGEFKETFAQVLFWGSIANMSMVAGTFYYTTLRYIVSWADPVKFVSIIVVGFIVMFIVEYKWIVPSIWAFRGRQMDMRNDGAADQTERFIRAVEAFAAMPQEEREKVLETLGATAKRNGDRHG